MPRPATDQRWIEEIRRLCAEESRRPSAGRIQRKLELLESESLGLAPKTPVPSEPVIRRAIGDYYALKEEQQLEYARFRWPQSMGTADLPWEASPVLLKLLFQLHIEGVERRPTNRLAKWWWRVHLAAPNASDEVRWDAVETLAGAEAVQIPVRSPEIRLAIAAATDLDPSDEFYAWLEAQASWFGEEVRLEDFTKLVGVDGLAIALASSGFLTVDEATASLADMGVKTEEKPHGGE